MPRDSEPREERHISTDQETVRTWADDHNAVPVEYQNGQYGLVPEAEADTADRRVDWDEFFDHVDENDSAVIYQQSSSDPFEVTRRDQALTQADTTDEDLEDRLIKGETVTTEVEETTVVETVVREEATIESELVDTELVDQRVVDADLVTRQCTSCNLVEETTGDTREWFDEDHYLETVETHDTERTGTDSGTRTLDRTDEFPYGAELDVEEEWTVTRAFVERFTVESHIADIELEETDTVEDRDIDLQELHRSVVESDILDIRGSPDEVMTQCDVESEFTDDDRVHTHFTRERTVEDRVVDRKRLRADVTGGEPLVMEVTETNDVGTEVTDLEDETVGDADVGTGAHTTEGETVEGTREVVLSEGEVGKTVVDATGDEIGEVETVADDGQGMYVDVKENLTEKVKSALNWGDSNDTYSVDIDQVRHVYEDEVVLETNENV